MPTINHGLTPPSVGADASTWGGKLNDSLNQLDLRSPSLTGKKADGTTPLPFTGAQGFAAGTVAAPGIAFGDDPDCGFYRIGANNLGLALNGAKQVDFALTSVAFTPRIAACAPAAGLSGYASINLPHGAAPTNNLANGDLWTTTAGLFVRVNGATVGPLVAGLTSVASADRWTTARSLTFTGDVTGAFASVDGSANVSTGLTIANNAVTAGKIASDAVTTAKILDGAVTLAKLANLSAAARLIGRKATAGAGAPQEMNPTEALEALGIAVDTANGEASLAGLRLKWGSASVTSAGSGTVGEATVTFANAFPTVFLGAVAMPELPSGAVSSTVYVPYVRTPTRFSMQLGLDDQSPSGSFTVYWLAWGR